MSKTDKNGLNWTEVEVPHNAHSSFDWASCICGWSEGGDDYDALEVAAQAHNAEHDGELITVWQVSR